ncbi:single-stranded DNA-binding protein [Mycolicibacterium fluoranthenivorans]|uniref:Single-strand DNA-binding protein n=1 Tax=Mycolicibacterium fluoranthenivorans TaxID=258505 RepID=A0A7X5U227_9MYCO|nr:single-stranded DNA-binding protein [Mycolicibacterium fluoranthenivorans]MCV7354442.1 single-stranded DNA-binding protein [Mycolicibacterium fluoranthenivorans]NIH96984.1 single-strand DNA-binding protein [Mycolicibacterium fluoranthenivorans]
MFETPFSVVGTVITDPVPRRVGDQDFTRFRVASNSRRRTAEGSWEPGNSLYLTVNCWGRVAEGVTGALFKGDPVVVVGHIYTNEYDDKEGNRRSSIEVRATSVGPDLSRCRIKIDPTRRAPEPAAASESGAAEGPEEADEHTRNSGELPISA